MVLTVCIRVPLLKSANWNSPGQQDWNPMLQSNIRVDPCNPCKSAFPFKKYGELEFTGTTGLESYTTIR